MSPGDRKALNITLLHVSFENYCLYREALLCFFTSALISFFFHGITLIWYETDKNNTRRIMISHGKLSISSTVLLEDERPSLWLGSIMYQKQHITFWYHCCKYCHVSLNLFQCIFNSHITSSKYYFSYCSGTRGLNATSFIVHLLMHSKVSRVKLWWQKLGKNHLHLMTH